MPQCAGAVNTVDGDSPLSPGLGGVVAHHVWRERNAALPVAKVLHSLPIKAENVRFMAGRAGLTALPLTRLYGM